MKNFLKRKKKNDKSSADDTPMRITNETVAEHREQVLAGGRKYKYPVQYQKHKLVINSLVIGVLAVVLLTILGWHQLYVAQNSSKLIYRITQVIPVQVASVDGEAVRYSDYLMRYRSSIFYLQKQEAFNVNDEDGKRQAAFIQRQELTNAERNALVAKIARETRLAISDDEVTKFIDKDLSVRSVSLNAFEKTVLESYYDWSLSEYRDVVRYELLKRKVSFSIDTDAQKKASDLLTTVKAGADFTEIAKINSDDEATKAVGGDSGLLPISSLDQNGLVATAQKLDSNQLSELLKGVDGYYFIKLTSKDQANVRYQVVKVALTAFDKRFDDLQKSGKIKEYISVAKEQ